MSDRPGWSDAYWERLDKETERKLRTLVQNQTVQQMEGLEESLRRTESATGNRKSSLKKRSTRKGET